MGLRNTEETTVAEAVDVDMDNSTEHSRKDHSVETVMEVAADSKVEVVMQARAATEMVEPLQVVAVDSVTETQGASVMEERLTVQMDTQQGTQDSTKVQTNRYQFHRTFLNHSANTNL
jgi:hypothetical protein